MGWMKTDSLPARINHDSRKDAKDAKFGEYIFPAET